MKAPTPRAGVGATPSPLSPKTQARIKNNRERALILRKQHQDRLDAPPMPQEWLPEHLRGDFVGRGERERRERAEQHALRHRAAAEVAASVDDAGAGGGDGAEPLIVDDGDIDRRMAEEWHWACDSDASTPGNSTPTPISYGIATVRPLADLGNTCFISCLVQLFLRMPKFLRRCQDCRDRQGRVNAPLCHLLADVYAATLHPTRAEGRLHEAYVQLVAFCRRQGWQPLDKELNVYHYGPGDPQKLLLAVCNQLERESADASSTFANLFQYEIVTRDRCCACRFSTERARTHHLLTPFLPVAGVEGSRALHLQTMLDRLADQATQQSQRCRICRAMQDHKATTSVTGAAHYLILRVRGSECNLRKLPDQLYFPRKVGCLREMGASDKKCPCGRCRPYKVVGSIEHTQQQGQGHFVATVPDDEGWCHVDGSHVSAHAPHQKAYLVVLRQNLEADDDRHQLQLGLNLPCVGCSVPSCNNHVLLNHTEVRQCTWLPHEHGLYAVSDIPANSFVASFGVQSMGCERQLAVLTKESSFCIRTQAAGESIFWSPKKYSPSDSSTAAALANHTCCSLCINATIVDNGDVAAPAAWIRTSRGVAAGEEIRISYGDSFNMQGCKCVCCQRNVDLSPTGDRHHHAHD